MIVTAPNSSYCLSSMAALRESQSLKSNFTKTHTGRVLDTRRPRVVTQEQVRTSVIVVILPDMELTFEFLCTGRGGTPLRLAPWWSSKPTPRTTSRTTSCIAPSVMRWSPMASSVTPAIARGRSTVTVIWHTNGLGRHALYVTPWNGDSEGKSFKEGR